MTDRPDGWAAMADIGRLGFDTAAAVIERILDLSRRAGDLSVPLLAPTAEGDPARRLRADAERLIDLYAEWTRALVDRALEAAATTTTTGPEVLVLGPVEPGGTAAATAWLHVLEADGTTAALRCTDLTGHDGEVVPAGSVGFEPPALDTSASPSHQVRVNVDVATGTAPGRYHGHLLVAGLPEVALPVRLDVT